MIFCLIKILVAIPSTMMVLCPLRLGCLPGRNSRFCVQNSRLHGLQALARRQPGTHVRRILVTLGLTDLGGITARVVRAALAAGTGAMLDVVIDERAPSLPYLRSVESSSVTLHLDPNNMCQLMTEADLAIGAAGTTSWERCCVGLPTILLVLADNQRFAARSLARAGAVKLLENTSDLELHLTAALHELSQSEALRLSLVRASAQVTDGLGAKRLAERVTREINSRPLAVGISKSVKSQSV